MAQEDAQHTAHDPARLCQGCGLAVEFLPISPGRDAYCPRCNTKLYRGHSSSFSTDLSLAVCALMLFIPVVIYPFLSIRLVGEMISSTMIDGVILMVEEGFPFVALLVFLCGFLIPLLHSLCVVMANLALHQKNIALMRWGMFGVYHLKHWMMIDVYIVSIAICCFKLIDYSDLHFGLGLPILAVLQLVCLSLVSRVNPRNYWHELDRRLHIQRNQAQTLPINEMHNCPHCLLVQSQTSHCVRCSHKMNTSANQSLQATWAHLIVATIALVPANLIPISILIANGERLEDTIFSGVISLVDNDMLVIAIIIFIASIVVPVAKILGIFYLLLGIHFKRTVDQQQRMILYYIVKWIGKWSMVDLFVMSIMLTLVDRGQILNFTPGFGAVAFGVVVVFTMFAAETLDSRLIWQNSREQEP